MVRVFVKGGAWTNAEDEALRALVQKVGLNRWASIATSIAHKSPEQCQQRWVDFLDPAINKGDWTAAEKRKLVQMYEIFPEQWQTIASQLPGRRHWQAKIMYAQLRDGGKLAEHGDGEEVVGSADGEIVGFGDYKLYHEMRAARADTIDGDEYSKQVTEFTRTRLANQKGKKQLRKEKDIMLAQTKMLAALERRREMEAAGIETHTQKKAFRRAVEEDAKSRLLAAGGALPEEDYEDDDEDDTAREPKPVVADLADIISSNDAIRQAASRKKTMLMSKDLNASSKKKEAALVPDFDIVGSVGALNKKPSGAAGSIASPSSPIHVVGNRKQQQQLSASSSTAKSTLLAITSHSHALGQSDALSALMSHYLSSESSSVSRLDKVTLDAKKGDANMTGGGGEEGGMSFVTKADLLGTIDEAPKSTEQQQQQQQQQQEIGAGTTDLLNFDSLPQPSASAAIHDDIGDLFGDLPAPSAVNAHSSDADGEDDALLNFDFLSDPTAASDSTDNVGAKRDADLTLVGDDHGKSDEEEGGGEEEEEEEERVNYVYKASALLNRHSHILWDAKGEWDSTRQQTDYIKKAREMIDAELRFIHNPLVFSYKNDNAVTFSPSLSATADEGDNALSGDANSNSNTAEPPKLVHPRVARMMEFAEKIANDGIDLSSTERLKEETNSVAAAVGALGDSDEDAFAEAELFASEARRVKGFYFVSYPSLETRVLEEEVEAESVQVNCANDLGLTHLVSSRGHQCTIDDAAPIASASEARREAYASMQEAHLGFDFYKEAFKTELLEAGRRRMAQTATPQGLLKPSSGDAKSSTTVVQPWQQVKKAHASLSRPLVCSAEKRPREESDTTRVGHGGDALDMLAAMYGPVA